MEIETVEAVIEQVSQNKRLPVEQHLTERMAALADLAYFQELAAFNRNDAGWTAVTKQIDPLAAKLEFINDPLFEQVRSRIRDGRYTPVSCWSIF
jgi:hypothetical protein